MAWIASDWGILVAWLAFVICQPFCVHKIHHLQWNFLKFYVEKNQRELVFASAPMQAWIVTFMWVFMMACVAAGSFIYWQLINSQGNLYIATLTLIIANVVAQKFYPVTMFEMKSRFWSLALLAFLISSAATVSALSFVDASRQNTIVYASGALWAAYTIWLIFVFVMTLPLTVKLIILDEMEKSMFPTDFETMYKKTVKTNPKTGMVTEQGSSSYKMVTPVFSSGTTMAKYK